MFKRDTILFQVIYLLDFLYRIFIGFHFIFKLISKIKIISLDIQVSETKENLEFISPNIVYTPQGRQYFSKIT